MEKNEKTVEIGIRERSAPVTLDEKKRTITVTFATETPVRTRDFNIGRSEKDYMINEILACGEGNVRLDRLKAGAPLLDSHDRYSGVRSVLGVIERCDCTDNKCEADVRFSERAEVEGIYQDVKKGIIRNISAGYRVYRYEYTGDDANGIPNYRAIDWEPMEISLVPVPADPNSQTRSESQHTNQSIIINNIRQMEKPEAPAAGHPAADPATQQTPAAPDLEKIRSEAVTNERKRVEEIRLAVRTAKLPEAFADNLITEGVTVDNARAAIITEFGKSDPHKPGITVTADEGEKTREAMANAILARINPSFITEEQGKNEKVREFRQLTMLEMCKERMDAAGERYSGMSKDELVTRALTTTDYPILLQDAINKTLTKSYQTLPQTWRKLARQWNAVDFKTIHAIKFGANIVLDKINEHGEYKSGKPAESEETWALETYGKIIPITRKTIINDDLNGFARVAEFIGQAVARKENSIMWGIITANGTMKDGKAIFHTDHANGKLSSGATISLDTLAAAKMAMRKQKGLDSEPINVTPKFLIVPPDLEMVAAQFTSQNYVPYESGKINPFAGWLEPIVEPLLTDTYAWYMAADPSMIDILAFTYLEGQAGPYTETRYGFEVDGMQVKVRHDFAGAVLDYRGLYKNVGH